MSNSGAAGVTDWVDSNADGLADGWQTLWSQRRLYCNWKWIHWKAQRYQADSTTDYQGIYFPRIHRHQLSEKHTN